MKKSTIKELPNVFCHIINSKEDFLQKLILPKISPSKDLFLSLGALIRWEGTFLGVGSADLGLNINKSEADLYSGVIEMIVEKYAGKPIYGLHFDIFIRYVKDNNLDLLEYAKEYSSIVYEVGTFIQWKNKFFGIFSLGCGICICPIQEKVFEK